MTREILEESLESIMKTGEYDFIKGMNPEDVWKLALLFNFVSIFNPCEDCISRTELKRKLQEHKDFYVNAYGGFQNMSYGNKSRVDEITDCMAMVQNMPSVQPKPKTEWIPVSERLPKNDEDVLVCYSQGAMEVCYYHIDNTFYPTEYADLNETGWFNENGDAIDEPIAWMPLPEPYKAESEEIDADSN